ncbi:hypothetical protein BOTBODRAFT_193036 [Botryobasidium botryosum FD-172 SS1]|uniref:Uncharacterized protein n=1 Tax=Botryobasidium botryosum (strain FD-172 SS1) TaxID=930990 RepID=A0A067LTN7_BOTB1|nr:hypothetical protein BOTBODRAFT_193036 [Botryobasidium botryosum FD-172 SS1]
MASIWKHIDPERIAVDDGAMALLWEKTWNKGTTDLFAFRLSFPGDIKYASGDSSVDGILVRRDYVTVLKAAIAWARGQDPAGIDREGDDEDDAPLVGIENPFSDREASVQATRPHAFILHGHPGVGKTLWLKYILVLRLLAGLPTIFVDNAQHLNIFNGAGAFKYKDYETELGGLAQWKFSTAMTDGCWRMVDSNDSLLRVPTFITGLRQFMMQAASPCAQRTKWVHRVTHPHIPYFMKPWTLSELIAGRDFQRMWSPPSEAQPETREAIGRLTYHSFQLLTKQVWSMEVDDSGDCYTYMLVAPLRGKRTQFTTDFATRYIYDQVRNALHASSYGEAARLFTILSRNPNTRASAGYILEDHFRQVIAQGIDTSAATNQSLEVEYQSLPQATLAGTHFPQNMVHYPPEVRGFVLYETHFQLEDGYYYLSATAFHGFTYASATRTATLFQVAVPSMRPISLGDIEHKGPSEFGSGTPTIPNLT